MSKYIPPHRRQQLPPIQTTHDIANFRWQGGRPASSGPASSGASSGRPSPSPSTSHSSLLQAHGDSFVGPLKQLKVVDVQRYSGATAKGLGNASSKQQIGQAIIQYLDRTKPENVLLQFGNVDINISSVYRLETSGAAAWDEKQFVADVWKSYDAFLRTRILPRLEKPPGHTSGSGDPPAYIRQLYICKATLPVVSDEALPLSHAKYQYPKYNDRSTATDRSVVEEAELQRQARSRMERVKLLVDLCGMEARQRMTADFNARLEGFVSGLESFQDPNDPLYKAAEIHVVDLNQHIRKRPGFDEVAAPFVTADPVSRSSSSRGALHI